MSGYPLQPATSREDKLALEAFFRNSAASLGGDLKGTFSPAHALPRELQHELEEEGMFFDKPLKTQYLAVCGAARHWPAGRGVIVNAARTYVMSINQEDHVRLVCKQKGADIQECFGRFCQLSQHLKEAARAASRDLMYSDRLGFLTTSIADLGIRASIFIRAPLFRFTPFVERCLVQRTARDQDADALTRVRVSGFMSSSVGACPCLQRGGTSQARRNLFPS